MSECSGAFFIFLLYRSSSEYVEFLHRKGMLCIVQAPSQGDNDLCFAFQHLFAKMSIAV